MKRLPVKFFHSETGREPVREWLQELDDEDRQVIGDEIRVAEFGWPVGMPICRSIQGHKGLWEIRAILTGRRAARVFFCIHENSMMLLHGFMKKTQKTPDREIEVALQRMKGLKS